jgi:hypothetical protein
MNLKSTLSRLPGAWLTDSALRTVNGAQTCPRGRKGPVSKLHAGFIRGIWLRYPIEMPLLWCCAIG